MFDAFNIVVNLLNFIFTIFAIFTTKPVVSRLLKIFLKKIIF